MFWLALSLTIPVVAATAAISLWAGWRVAQSVTGEQTLIFALDEYGLWVVGLAVGVVLWKFTAPALARETWPTQRISTAIFILTWMGAVAGSATFVLASAAPLMAVSGRANLFLGLALSWILLDVIASLLPTALMNPSAWDRTPRLTASTGSSPGNSIGWRAARPLSATIQDNLLVFLQDTVLHGPGEVYANVFVEPGGSIETSQGTLARLLRVTKSTMNRQLHALSADGQIILHVSARCTRIEIVREGDRSGPERGGPNDATH